MEKLLDGEKLSDILGGEIEETLEMQTLQKMDIDWDIHRLIEAERQGFDEPPYIALRRLLKLPAPERAASGGAPVQTGVPWVEDGVQVPHGSLARMEYQRGSQVYEGQFLDGKLVVNGNAYDTLSAAAGAVAKTKDGTSTSLNGWLYWSAKFPGENKWRKLRDMRRKPLRVI